jgi:hypothetical protein
MQRQVESWRQTQITCDHAEGEVQCFWRTRFSFLFFGKQSRIGS